MKVTGYYRPGETEKSYRINHEGRDYFAIRRGSLFEIAGYVGTLKAVKAKLAAGELRDAPLRDECGSASGNGPSETDAVEEAPEPSGGKPTWRCLSPAAIVAALYPAITEGRSPEFRRAVEDTLDAAGFMDDGQVDSEAGKRVIRGYLTNLKIGK